MFMDPDMIVTGDIQELAEIGLEKPVHMVKDQPRFEWPSMMLFDCEKLKHLTPEYVTEHNMFELDWAEIGDLPRQWNCCIGYEEVEDPKLWHYTKGIPVWKETEGLLPETWYEYWRSSNSTVEYSELMGQSIHANHA